MSRSQPKSTLILLWSSVVAALSPKSPYETVPDVLVGVPVKLIFAFEALKSTIPEFTFNLPEELPLKLISTDALSSIIKSPEEDSVPSP